MRKLSAIYTLYRSFIFQIVSRIWLDFLPDNFFLPFQIQSHGLDLIFLCS
jgi:hypothetical protein